MNLTCGYCGVVAMKDAMVVSRHTKNAWCIDEIACGKRKAKVVREEKRERARAS